MRTKLFAIRMTSIFIQGEYLAVVEAKSSTKAEELINQVDINDMDIFKIVPDDTNKEIKKLGVERIIVIGGYEE